MFASPGAQAGRRGIAMKLELVGRAELNRHFDRRFPEESDLKFGDWRRNRDRVARTLSRHGRIDLACTGTGGDFSVAEGWYGERVVQVCANARRMVAANVLDEVLCSVESNEPEYGVMIAGTYPQVLLTWSIGLTRDRKMIAFGPSFDDRLRDADGDPEALLWADALDALWR